MLLMFIASLPAAVFTQAPVFQEIGCGGAGGLLAADVTLSAPEQWETFAVRPGLINEMDVPTGFAFHETESAAQDDERRGSLNTVIAAPPFLEITLPVFATEDSGLTDAQSEDLSIPQYDAWVSMLRDQPRPRRADEFLEDIKRIFAEEGVPAELAWLPEIESMFDPRARNTVGACGLFQLMPVTARELGLRLWPYDERTNPEKSARAAASLLRRLHGVFDSWPLALAAYNAGEGRVRRTLKAGDATTFAEIAHTLPSETRLYVPKVLATLAVREGISPSALPAPRLP